MASKRKLDDDPDSLVPASKYAKSADEITRSGRVRKKPARFQDIEGEGDEDGTASPDCSKASTGSAEVAKSTPKSQKVPAKAVLSPTEAEMPKQMKMVLTTVPKPASPAVKTVVIPKLGQAATVMKVLSEQSVAPGVKDSPIPPMPPSSLKNAESVEQTKTGRVRKKSTKVLEMEAFEEAEKTKVAKKIAGETPPKAVKTPGLKKLIQTPPVGDKGESSAPDLSPTALTAVISMFPTKSPVKMEPSEQMLDTSIPPQGLPAPAIQGKINPALVNLPPFPPSKLGTPASKKSKKKKDDLKVIPEALAAIPPMPPSALGSTKKAIPKSKKNVEVEASPASVKAEPLEGVKGQPTQVLNPALLAAVAETVRVKKEPASPIKSQKKTAAKVVTQSELSPVAEAGSNLTAAAAAKSKSVIKMLLNTPTQFPKPSVSTQSINSEKPSKSTPPFPSKSPTSDTDILSDPAFVKCESILDTSTLDQGIKMKLLQSPTEQLTTHPENILMTDQSSLLDDSLDKKKGKKTPLRKSISIEQMDEDEDDDEDDDDDDDFDNGDDSGDWEFENQDGKLVIADFAGKGLDIDEDSGQHVTKGKKSRSKTKTVGGKKASKSKSDALDGDDGKKQGKASKEKKKKRLTAYTMWCNTVRAKVLNENQGMDFAQLSRRLGEIWQGLPAKEKMAWKRKAKREARKLLGKGLLISTSKGGGGIIHTSIPSASAVSAAAAAAVSGSSHQPSVQIVQQQVQQPKPVLQKNTEDCGIASSKVFGFEPIDVAAHLKLVGESLTIIGTRLQEHRGNIAVQGSLSVLLDSMLCAFGPLTCLTAQVPEMNGCSAETHSRTLDNIAYFMPGL